ncbi:MAG TPA: protease inhibitor I42 family protein [Nitrospirales bacterium]|jgi:predicted secreted protein
MNAGEAWTQDKVLSTRLGGTVIIRLWEDRTRGEIYIPLFDNTGVALANDDYDRSMGENWNVVDSGKHVFEFRALKPGVHRIVFEKRMGWRFTAEDRRVYVLMVNEENVDSSGNHA